MIADFEGDQAFSQMDGGNTFSALFDVLNHVQLGSIIITVVSLVILIAWDKFSFLKKLKLIPGALVAVVIGVVLNEIFIASGSSLAIAKEHLVSLPVPSILKNLKLLLVTPDFSGITNPKVWVVGLNYSHCCFDRNLIVY